MQTLELTLPAPADLGIELLGVPEGSPVELDLRLEAVMEGVLASGRADALSGRYIHAEHDDIEDLIRRADEIAENDLNAIRLQR